MIKIQGDYGEGGGAILRVAIALSAITQKPFKIFNIRKGRTKSGLKQQHLTGVLSTKKLCNAEIQGAKLSSTELTFKPNKIISGNFNFDIKTAGSIALLLQTILPIAAFSQDKCTFKLKGGTDVSFSPTIDYFKHIFSYHIGLLGYKINSEIIQRGFYPKGNGIVKVTTYPWKELKSFNHLKQGQLKYIDVFSIATKDLKNALVVERQIKGFQKLLEIRKKNKEYVDSLSTGTSFHAHAHFENSKLGVCTLGERGKPAEKVGEESALLLKKEIGSEAVIDHWMADQILPYLSLISYKLKIKNSFKASSISNHLKTNAWVIEKFLPVKIGFKENVVEISYLK